MVAVTTVDKKQIDWVALARRMHEVQVKMIHHGDTGLSGWEFEAEVLRRAFGYSANDSTDGHRQLPYESVNASTGLITCAEADHIRDGHTIIDRLAKEDAIKQRDAARAEARRVLREAARDVAEHVRSRCNERTVPSRFRREGVLLAADWIAAVPVRQTGARDALAEVAAGQYVRDLVEATEVELEYGECDCGKKTCCAPAPEVFSLVEAGAPDAVAEALLGALGAAYERHNGLRRLVLTTAWEVDPLAAGRTGVAE